MSNNSFAATDVPPWLSTLQSLTSLYVWVLVCVLADEMHYLKPCVITSSMYAGSWKRHSFKDNSHLLCLAFSSCKQCEWLLWWSCNHIFCDDFFWWSWSFLFLQISSLKNNRINGTLNIGSSYSNQLHQIDLQNNLIDSFTQRAGYTMQIM